MSTDSENNISAEPIKLSLKDIEQFIVQIKERQTNISVERDKIREMINELEGLSDSCDRAIEDLNCAADSLSELV